MKNSVSKTQDHRGNMRELTVEECKEVSGGVIWFALITAASSIVGLVKHFRDRNIG